MSGERQGPLAGVRVVDLTSVFAGPSASQVLADLGADVIKVESPEGDVTRRIGPGHEAGLGPTFIGLNRSKRAISLDLKTDDGREALLRIVSTADVFLCSVRPAAMERLGLGYDALRQRNPSIIYAAIVGFAQNGPNAALAVYDDLVQAASGISSLLSHSGSPEYMPVAIADRTVGMMTFGAIAAALYGRERTGEGQEIEIPMFETMAGVVLGDHLYGETFIPARGPMGYPRLTSHARRPYRTADGFLCCIVYTDAHWQEFLSLTGTPELWTSDARFADLTTRTGNIDALYSLVAERLLSRTTAEWLDALRARDIPCFPVNDLPSLLEDPQLDASEFFEVTQHPVVGQVRLMRHPLSWGGRTMPLGPAPSHGQHTRTVLAEAGYSESEIDALIEAGAASGDATTR
ncbi:CoA transferase [Cnuibacter physcomitrellae]|uniref:CaiB/BaiF CoA transferase family protein n=1 Tax=Cnuibacter physcomitrellae TaxID=1619308 RepID=UPI002176154E|nr:CoA transferase [Cnuibacter physcomitrellae]MCS5498250.1 CoA transferase [Cnuibacter physcomitrellae]